MNRKNVAERRSAADSGFKPGKVGLIIALILTASGCDSGKGPVSVDYGRQRGRAATSVNGVSVLAEMFRQSGRDVDRYKKLSPRIDRYETLVWFPDNAAAPSHEAIERIEQWLSGGYDRTLIYVGRDYDSQLDYYQTIAQQLEGQQKEKALRELADAHLQQDQRRWDTEFHWAWNDTDADSCRWFDQEREDRKVSGEVQGPLLEGLPEDLSPRLVSNTRLVPAVEYGEDYSERQLNVLLEHDGQPFVFAWQDVQMEQQEDDWQYHYQTDNKVIFVENGSFLLNYGLVHPDNRQLAAALIEYCSWDEHVLFLESDASGIQVSDTEYDSHDTWAWVAQPPLSYMVPHFMMWGILFCFAFFPIFGRPRRLPDGQQRSFGEHIAAIGRILSRQQTVAQARQTLVDYKQSVGGEGSDNR